MSVLEKGTYHGTRNDSDNHISPDLGNFLTKLEIWDTLFPSALHVLKVLPL